jgi:tRNA threonylcarbamoyladenosine biosynthesis protein TsaB
MERGHSETLMPMVQDVVTQAAAAWADVDRVATTIGPGSFTGVRIALAAARGFALACGARLVGATTTQVAAFRAMPEADGRAILAVVDAGRADLFVQSFGPDLAERSAVAALSPEAAAAMLSGEAVLIAGNGAPRLRPLLTARNDIVFAEGLADAADVAALGALLKPQDQAVLPVYVHPPYAKLPEGYQAPGGPMTPAIRPAGGEAAQALAALHAACLDPGWSAASVASFLAVPGSFALLAWGDGVAQGTAAAAGFILCRVAADVCDLAAMGVLPAARRRGLGRALLAAACAEARRLGAREMFLEVAEHNLAARALYR